MAQQQPPLPPGPPPGGGGFDPLSLPPITQMLFREGEAWRALLALHGGVLSRVHQISDPSAVAAEEAAANASENRELQYCSNLTHLASMCDALHAEAIKLRGLRKARASLDVQMMQAVLDTHVSETLALGSSVASTVSMSLQSATVDVRTAIQETRLQLAQTRALLEQLKDAPDLRRRIKIRLQAAATDDAEQTTVEVSPDDIFSAVYKRGPELTEDILLQAIDDLLLKAPATDSTPARSTPSSEVAVPPQRTVFRRTGDRAPVHQR